MSPTETRRRGAELETAILDAAREELLAGGYAGFTIEGVAERAATSRHVVYRRWSTRADLAVAAMRHDMARDAIPVPDTGSLRGDLIALMTHANKTRLAMAAIFSLHLGTYYQETGMTPSTLREELLGTRTISTDVIMDRAAARGEVDAARLTPRRRALAADLFRHEVLMTLKPVPKAVIEELVDIALDALGVARVE
ncbi:TetR/AcrR family transcriptional regulator [soil metagenome]